jgi:hypothetical protein
MILGGTPLQRCINRTVLNPALAAEVKTDPHKKSTTALLYQSEIGKPANFATLYCP